MSVKSEFRQTEYADWAFEVIEIVSIPETVKKVDEIDSLIRGRETHWIQTLDSINKGYNSKG